MKKLFLSCCLLICGLMTYAQSSEIPTHLVIENRYHGPISIPLKDNPKMTFNFKMHRIYIDTSDIRYDILMNYDTKISYYKIIASIEQTKSTDYEIELQPAQLCFSTSRLNTHISIVDIKGNIIMTETIDSGNYYFSLSDLLPGSYIAKINDTTIKFIKR